MEAILNTENTEDNGEETTEETPPTYEELAALLNESHNELVSVTQQRNIGVLLVLVILLDRMM